MSRRPAFRWKTNGPQGRSTAAPARLRIIAIAFGALAAAISARSIHLQGLAADRFLVSWDETTTVLEPIPAANGRIVSADGVVLAFDRTRFDLSVHYRWLEDPPNPRWLSQQARQRLAPRDRRDSQALEQARTDVLAARDRLWQALSAVTGAPQDSLRDRRRDVQTRIARMAARVESRNVPVHVALTTPSDPAPITLQSLWSMLVSELTTPPQRDRVDPIVLKEELQLHPVLSDLSLSTAAAIESAPSQFPPGVVSIVRRHERVYPARDLAAHVIGSRRTQASGTDRVPRGESGVELAYDSVLRGQDGLRRITFNRRREVIDSTIVRQPVEGRDVTLSIVAAVQRDAEAILERALAAASEELPDEVDSSAPDAPPSRPRGGTIVAIDVATGDLIAAASAPRFDLNLFNEFDAARWRELMDDPRRPFFPRATAMTAPPGSVYKVLTAIAALEEHIIEPETVLHCQGYLNRPDQLRCMIFRQHGLSHGDVTISDALCQSCNVYFFEAARRMGDEPLRRWSERFGFGAPTGADLPGEAAGQLPRPAGSRRARDAGSTLQLAIGQSSLLVSPLQVARMMAVIANGGALLSPRFAHVTPVAPASIASSSFEGGASPVQLASAEFVDDSPAGARLDLSPRTIAVIRESLERVVEDPRGTGRAAAVEGIRIAGKTGTAETGANMPDHAWFAGYAPADRPRVAFVVMLEHAGSGGRTAGPVARDFVHSLQKHGIINTASTQGP